MSDNNEQNVLDELESSRGTERELPPLDDKKTDSNHRLKSKKNRVVMIVFFGFALVLFAAVFLGLSSLDGDKKESSETVLGDLNVEGVKQENILDSLSPLLLDSDMPLTKTQKEPRDAVEVGSEHEITETDLGYDQDRLGADLSDVLHQLKVIDTRLEMLEMGTLNLSEQVVLERSLLTAEVERGEFDAKRIEVLETELAALVKEVKRLKWLARQKKVASKKRVEQLEQPKVMGFFVWQYRPGVELMHNGVSERFYEGDVLDGMRLIKIDMDLKQVVFSKNGKRIILKSEVG